MKRKAILAADATDDSDLNHWDDILADAYEGKPVPQHLLRLASLRIQGLFATWELLGQQKTEHVKGGRESKRPPGAWQGECLIKLRALLKTKPTAWSDSALARRLAAPPYSVPIGVSRIRHFLKNPEARELIEAL